MNPVIVIGMHRSGTSLMVKVLEKLGVFMGADQEANGESLFFNLTNVWILRQAHTRWDNPKNFKYFSNEAKNILVPLTKKRLTSFNNKKYFGKIREQRSFSNINFLWGWKDPRNTFTLDVWKEIFGNMKIIHIYRNPMDVINSLSQREKRIKPNFGNSIRTKIREKIYGFKLPQEDLFYRSFRSLSFEGGFSLWKEYTEKALSVSINDPSQIYHLSFEELLTAPSESVKKLSTFLKTEKKKIDHRFMNINRKYAFVENPDLIKFYHKIKEDEMVVKLGYGNIYQS